MNIQDFQKRQERIANVQHRAQLWQQRSYGYPIYSVRRQTKRQPTDWGTLALIVLLIMAVAIYSQI